MHLLRFAGGILVGDVSPPIGEHYVQLSSYNGNEYIDYLAVNVLVRIVVEPKIQKFHWIDVNELTPLGHKVISVRCILLNS